MNKNRVLAIIAALLVVAVLIVLSTGKVQAAPTRISKSFTGFAFEKSLLTPTMKTEITNWVTANPGYGMVSCIGYTGFNVKKRDQVFLQNLAVARAKRICDFIHTSSGGISVFSTKGIPGDGKTATARKVTVFLIKVPDEGNGGGTGTVTVGVCDSALRAIMQSKIVAGDFSFARITIRDISTTCKGNVMDVYLLDESGNQLASSLDNEITTTWLRLGSSLFTPTDVRSNLIKKVAFEFRKN